MAVFWHELFLFSKSPTQSITFFSDRKLSKFGAYIDGVKVNFGLSHHLGPEFLFLPVLASINRMAVNIG